MMLSADTIGAVAHPVRLMARFRRVASSPARPVRLAAEDDARRALSADWQGIVMPVAGPSSLEHLARITFG